MADRQETGCKTCYDAGYEDGFASGAVQTIGADTFLEMKKCRDEAVDVAIKLRTQRDVLVDALTAENAALRKALTRLVNAYQDEITRANNDVPLTSAALYQARAALALRRV